MQWFTRLVLGLPPRAQDIRELRELAPELFFDREVRGATRRSRVHFHPAFWDSHEFREAVRAWVQEFDEQAPESQEGEPCDHPFCPRKQRSLSANESPHAVMEMMVVAGGTEFNPPAKSFFDLINATKKKYSIVRRVIMTDPFIYADIGQSGSRGGFTNLVKLLGHLNIEQTTSFELQLTPRVGQEKRDELQNMIKKEFPDCTLTSHKSTSTFHDRFIFVEYHDGERRAWYGPSLNGLNSDSIVIFGDVTEASALKQLSQRLLSDG